MSDKPEGTKDMAQRPPYVHRSEKDFGEVKWRGRCQCGQVRYKVNQEKPLKAKFCHCRGCQMTHAAPFQWAAIFKKESLLFDKGAEGLAFYSSTNKTRDYSLPTKVFCSWCRSPIMDEGRNVCLLFPESIECGDTDAERLEWRKAFEVDCHIFYNQRILEIPDGKPKWAGMDEDSEMVDDMGKPTK
ncbi:GFA family protein [Aspergillus saccharolyticus JOP 1030-1]|uniref:CENP-V/GFA domain-containing protein n=1 Tax=Aspergillus saccharolyticus JOP 1030-1 TaxID=1450539 RepID=A0A319AA45_9EURO|nr:hypothetical protein BP01DRAFT_289616 [Aspergillus saccharolyticus JOP 1030-1]PYH48508.1 hypothetical protein BP01DRAFT_289616 [Aspergillus saccharolyticus JOP 1030-1]